jgi:hypothetical protein
MPWDDGTNCTSGGTSYNTRRSYITANYAATSGSTATITSYATSGNTTYIGTLSNITDETGSYVWPWPVGITSVAGYTSDGVVGFATDQISALRKDFDQVKKDWKRKRAEVKARRLFHKIVGTIRYRRFREIGYHEIVGPSGRRYRLSPGQWIKVIEKGSDKIEHLLCAHLEFGIPWFDTMIVQHLMLTSNKDSEKQFLKLANVHSVAGPYPIPELRVA